MRKNLFLAIIFMIGFHGLPAWADDVIDQVNEGLKAYEAKDFSTAAVAFSAATNLIRQKQAEQLTALLPEALSGWTANDSESGSASPMAMGGGIQAKRVYRKGRDQVTVTIMGQSPLLQSMSMMFNNPMFQSGNSKLVIMDGRKVMQDKRQNSLTTMIANKLLVSVKGRRRAELDDVKAYFKAIDFAALKKFVN